MPFLLKKLLGTLAMPLTALPLLALFFLWLLARHSRQPLRALLVALPLLALWALSTPIVAAHLFRGEEAPWTVLDPQERPAPDVLVVLSGGSSAARNRTVFDGLNAASLQRTLEGVRLAAAWPEATLLLSGGNGPEPGTTAERMAAVARTLGIAPERIEVENESLDTQQQAMRLAAALAEQDVVLVTSALHMRRSLALFRSAGLDPVPAPADFTDLQPSPHELRAWIPEVGTLVLVTALFHERLGLLWARFRGQIDGTPPGP